MAEQHPEVWGPVPDLTKGGDRTTRHREDFDDAAHQDRIGRPGKRPREAIRQRAEEQRFKLNQHECHLIATASLANSYTKFGAPNCRADIALVSGLCYEFASFISERLVANFHESRDRRKMNATANAITYGLLEFAPFKRYLEQIFEAVPQFTEILFAMRSALTPSEPHETVPFDELVWRSCAKYSHRRLARCGASRDSGANVLELALQSRSTTGNENEATARSIVEDREMSEVLQAVLKHIR